MRNKFYYAFRLMMPSKSDGFHIQKPLAKFLVQILRNYLSLYFHLL